MQQSAQLNLKILLPFRIFLENSNVSRIILETHEGSYGLLPHRLDCVAALVPGILSYEQEGKEIYLAVDEGVMVKAGANVLVSVRNAIGGEDLGKLRKSVDTEFLNRNEQEKTLRSVMAKMESSFMSRLARLNDD